MKITRTVTEFRAYRQTIGQHLGLVPTMGYLHDGHKSLINAAKVKQHPVAVSIFVNPTQFNNPDDLATYPRDEAQDFELLEASEVDVVFSPSPAEVYPPNYQTYIDVEQISQGLEGAHRAGHFRGVATVVGKLFNIIQPSQAYFGQKDAQQVAVIRQMVLDLNFPIEIITCPIIRESDGLAMSSRNAKLSTVERKAATILYKALSIAKDAYESGSEHHPQKLRDIMQHTLQQEKMARIDYVSIADAITLKEQENPTTAPLLLSMAVHIGDTRLIDNIIIGE